MGWPSRLSYQQVAATGIARSLVVLASYGDVDTARAVLVADPSLAEDPEALAAAARAGHASCSIGRASWSASRSRPNRESSPSCFLRGV